jgi:hypothetical protein
LEPKLWNKKILEEDLKGFKKFDYKNYIKDDLVLRESLLSIVENGAVIIENVIILK